MQLSDVRNVFDPQQLTFESTPQTSHYYEGVVKRYDRPIKYEHTEKVYKYVLFKAAYQYFGKMYLNNMEIDKIVEDVMDNKARDYDQIKYQIETEDRDRMDLCTDVLVRTNGLSSRFNDDMASRDRDEVKCDLDTTYYISMIKKRETGTL